MSDRKPGRSERWRCRWKECQYNRKWGWFVKTGTQSVNKINENLNTRGKKRKIENPVIQGYERTERRDRENINILGKIS